MLARPVMPVIFVSSPYRGNVERNVELAIEYCRFVIRQGSLPYAPHLLLTRILDDSQEHERRRGMHLGLEMLKLCDGLWAFGPVSEGMRAEIEMARAEGKPIRFFDAEMREYKEGEQQ